jgi:thymidylate kinase
MGKIIVLDGSDGTGKSTLARNLANKTKGHILHCSYDKSWDFVRYFEAIMDSAVKLSHWQTVIVDRWVPSGQVYDIVFRGGIKEDYDSIIDLYKEVDITWVYCKNEFAIENHLRNAKKRDEMYDDMTEVVKEFDKYIKNSKLSWITYDFNELDVNNIIERILK